MKNLIIFLCALPLSVSAAYADAIAISCSKNPAKVGSEIVAFTSDSLRAEGKNAAYASYLDRKVSKNAEYTTIESRGKIVRYIVKDGTLTLVFSHLEKCGDMQENQDDWGHVTVTRTARGKKTVVARALCACDID